jgi:hypothetical protein
MASGAYDGTLDWPTTLGALMRLLGRRVTVAVGVPGDERGPALVVNVTGTLVVGWDLGAADQNLVGETLLFHFEEDSAQAPGSSSTARASTGRRHPTAATTSRSGSESSRSPSPSRCRGDGLGDERCRRSGACRRVRRRGRNHRDRRRAADAPPDRADAARLAAEHREADRRVRRDAYARLLSALEQLDMLTSAYTEAPTREDFDAWLREFRSAGVGVRLVESDEVRAARSRVGEVLGELADEALGLPYVQMQPRTHEVARALGTAMRDDLAFTAD